MTTNKSSPAKLTTYEGVLDQKHLEDVTRGAGQQRQLQQCQHDSKEDRG